MRHPAEPARAGERGSVTVLVAVSVGLAMVMTLFVLDLWRAEFVRGQAQSAADAAALAAAGAMLARDGPSPSEAAGAYAAHNGAELESCRCDNAAGEAVVTVRIRFRLGILGGAVRVVRATARAIVEGWADGMRGMQPWFAARLGCLFSRVPGLSIVSGFRTHAEQIRLFREKPGLAAPPGHSLHEIGLAADLGFPSAPAEARAHAVAPACGLGFGVPGEPWHVSPAGWE